MPLPRNRSRSVKRKKKKKGKILYKRKKQTKITCAICSHVVRKQKSKAPRFPRKFGSTLCNMCSRLVLSYADRVKQGTMKLDTLNISYQKYVSQLLK